MHRPTLLTLFCAALVILASPISASGSFSINAEVFTPQEDVLVHGYFITNATLGASLKNVSSTWGYDVQLTRNDLLELYFIVPRNSSTTGEVQCFPFKLPSPMPLPTLPTQASYQGLTEMGTTTFMGSPAVHYRATPTHNRHIGVYVDPTTWMPRAKINSEGMGSLSLYTYDPSAAAPESAFAVPPACASATRQALPADVAASLASSDASAFQMGGSLDAVREHLRTIASHDTASSSYTLAHNAFVGSSTPARLAVPLATVEEATAAVAPLPRYTPTADTLASLPASINRYPNFTADIRDQGNCGGCWSFATAAGVETVVAVAGGALESLAPQNLLDCVAPGNGVVAAKGCNGGWPATALAYINSTGGIAREVDYPFRGTSGRCNGSVPHTSAVSQYQVIKAGDADAIAAAVVEHGAVVAIIQVLGDFIFYAGGVYDDASCTGRVLSHAVTIVGYGTSEAGEPYWVVKNSFGTAWGESGLFRMARGKNMCGIENWGVVPIV